MISALPPAPPAIYWDQITEVALEDQNLCSNIKIDDSTEVPIFLKVTVDENNGIKKSTYKNPNVVQAEGSSLTAIDSGSVSMGDVALERKKSSLDIASEELEEYFRDKLTIIRHETCQNEDQFNSFLQEAELKLTDIKKQLHDKTPGSTVVPSQAIQEAHRDMLRALFFLRKKFGTPLLVPQVIEVKSGKWSVIKRAPNPEVMILSGGGMKGAGYMGACKALEESGAEENMKIIAGSSAGAITAAFKAAGMNAEALQAASDSINYWSLLTGESKDLPVHESEMFGNEGYFKGTYAMFVVNQEICNSIANFFSATPQEALEKKLSILEAEKKLTNEEKKQLLELKESIINGAPQNQWVVVLDNNDPSFVDEAPSILKYRVTFQDIALLRKLDPTKFKQLIVTGFDKTTGRERYFNEVTSPAMPIMEAVRISMSLPVIFKPVKIDSEDVMEDGGIGSNTPSEVSHDPITTLVCAFNNDGGFYDIVNSRKRKKSEPVITWLFNALESWITANKNLAKDMEEDNKKIYNAGINALDIYHGTLGVTNFNASDEQVHSAQLQAEVRMWEQLSLRQNQGVHYMFDTLGEAISGMSDQELRDMDEYYNNKDNNTLANNWDLIVKAIQDELARRGSAKSIFPKWWARFFANR